MAVQKPRASLLALMLPTACHGGMLRLPPFHTPACPSAPCQAPAGTATRPSGTFLGVVSQRTRPSTWLERTALTASQPHPAWQCSHRHFQLHTAPSLPASLEQHQCCNISCAHLAPRSRGRRSSRAISPGVQDTHKCIVPDSTPPKRPHVSWQMRCATPASLTPVTARPAARPCPRTPFPWCSHGLFHQPLGRLLFHPAWINFHKISSPTDTSTPATWTQSLTNTPRVPRAAAAHRWTDAQHASSFSSTPPVPFCSHTWAGLPGLPTPMLPIQVFAFPAQQPAPLLQSVTLTSAEDLLTLLVGCLADSPVAEGGVPAAGMPVHDPEVGCALPRGAVAILLQLTLVLGAAST